MSAGKLLAVYPVPSDREAFHRGFEREIVAAALAVDGVRAYRVTVPLDAHGLPLHVTAELVFDDLEAAQRARTHPSWEALARADDAVSTGGPPVYLACVEHALAPGDVIPEH